MTEAYMIVKGGPGESLLRVFGDKATATDWATRYNAKYRLRSLDHKALVEEVPFTPAGETPPAP
jgi:hypothetical protein